MAKVELRTDERTLVVTINRPEKRNAVDGDTAKLLGEAFGRFRDDPELWVLVLTGAGEESFSAGADLSAVDTLGPPPGSPPSALRHFVLDGPGWLGCTRITDIEKPILCAVNGYALAGGLELACLGDMRIAERHAQFGVACRRFNVPLVDGGTQRLPRIVGMGHAMDLILTGRFIGAEEAYRMGLANEIVDLGKSLERCLELARALCELPQGAMRTDKRAAHAGFGCDLETGLRIEAQLGLWSIQSADLRAGANAFTSKAKPEFAQDD